VNPISFVYVYMNAMRIEPMTEPAYRLHNSNEPYNTLAATTEKKYHKKTYISIEGTVNTFSNSI